MQRLGYGIAALTLLAMVVHAIVLTISGHPDTYDHRAYLIFITPATVVFLVLGIRGNRYVGWGFLVSAFGAEQAAAYGLASHWSYAVAFVVATVLAQVFPMWHELPRKGVLQPRLGPPVDE